MAQGSSLDSQSGPITELQAKIEALVATDATFAEGISAARPRADEAYELAQSAKIQTETNASNLADLKSTVESNQTIQEEKLEAAISAHSTDVEYLQKFINSNTDLIGKLTEAIEGNTSSIGSLESSVFALDGTVATLQSQISALEKGKVQATLDKANENAAHIASLDVRLTSLEGSCEEFQTTLIGEMVGYLETLNSASEGVAANAKAIGKLQDALEKCYEQVSANSSSIATNAGNISKNAEGIQNNAEAIAALKSAIGGLTEDVSDNSESIASLAAILVAANAYADDAVALATEALNENLSAKILAAQNVVNAAQSTADAANGFYATTDGTQLYYGVDPKC